MAEVTKITIDEDECISCEACVAECEEVFEMNDDKAVIKAEANNPEAFKKYSDAIVSAAESCPSDAIKLETA